MSLSLALLKTAVLSSSDLVLDRLSVQAVAVYPHRRLSAACVGFWIRVRRSSDSLEQIILFTADSVGIADLLAFVGGGEGFIVRWYDKSGNGFDATQSIAANQPRIVSGGTLDTQNGKACIRQVLNARWLDLPDIMATASAATVVSVYNQPITSSFGLYNGDPAFNGWGGVNGDNNFTSTPWGTGSATDSFCSVTQQVFASYGARNALRTHTMRQTGTVLQCFRDGTQVDTDKTIGFKTTVNNNRLLNGDGGGIFFSEDSLCEAVFFRSALSTADRQLLERDQGTYYGYTVA